MQNFFSSDAGELQTQRNNVQETSNTPLSCGQDMDYLLKDPIYLGRYEPHQKMFQMNPLVWNPNISSRNPLEQESNNILHIDLIQIAIKSTSDKITDCWPDITCKKECYNCKGTFIFEYTWYHYIQNFNGILWNIFKKFNCLNHPNSWENRTCSSTNCPIFHITLLRNLARQ